MMQQQQQQQQQQQSQQQQPQLHHAQQIQQQTGHPTVNNSSMNLLADMKNPVNMMSTSIPTSLNLGNMNMTSPYMSAIHNQLESIMNTNAQVTNLQNSHSVTMSQQQQHSNGFTSVKRDNSPSNMLNNNGIPGLNIAGMNMSGMGSIFDPIPMNMGVNVQMPQLPVKKEEKPMAITQGQMTHKAMDGMYNNNILFFLCSLLESRMFKKFTGICGI